MDILLAAFFICGFVVGACAVFAVEKVKSEPKPESEPKEEPATEKKRPTVTRLDISAVEMENFMRYSGDAQSDPAEIVKERMSNA